MRSCSNGWGAAGSGIPSHTKAKAKAKACLPTSNSTNLHMISGRILDVIDGEQDSKKQQLSLVSTSPPPNSSTSTSYKWRMLIAYDGTRFSVWWMN